MTWPSVRMERWLGPPFYRAHWRARRPNGTIETWAANLPMINPVNFTAEGRLFTGQIGKPDTLIEIDLTGKKPPRTIASNIGGINAFDDDGQRGDQAGLYVPLADKGAVGRVDLATGTVCVIADGLGQPVSVVANERSDIFVADYGSGEILKLKPGATPDRHIVVSGLQRPVGLALDKLGHLVVSEAISGTLSRINLSNRVK